MQQVIIHNTHTSPLTISKLHKVWCEITGTCSCTAIRTVTYDYDRNPASKTAGERLPRPINRLVCDSFMVRGRTKSDPLPEAVLQLPDVEGARAARRIRIIRI